MKSGFRVLLLPLAGLFACGDDTAPVDGGTDSGMQEQDGAGPSDFGDGDSGSPDRGPLGDTGSVDTGTPDGGSLDSGQDSGSLDGGGMDAADGGSGPSVAPLYSGFGDWARWVQNDGADPFSATGVACTIIAAQACSSRPSGTAIRTCLHGGELRRADFPGLASCTGVTLDDTLGVFDWICDDTSGHVVARSRGLRADKRLADLIDFTPATPVWRTNAVRAASAAGTITTPSSAWWANTILVDNDGGTFATQGQVIAVTANATGDYTLNADSISLIVRPGFRLLGANSGGAVVGASGMTYLWVEAEVDAAQDQRGIDLSFAALSTVIASSASGAAQNGVTARGVGFYARDVVGTNNGNYGVQVGGACGQALNSRANDNEHGFRADQGTNDALISGVEALRNNSRSVDVLPSERVVVEDVRAASNGFSPGIEVIDGRIRRVRAASASQAGVGFVCTRTVIHDVFSANNYGVGGGGGVRLINTGSDCVLVDVISASHSAGNMVIQGSGNVVMNVTAANTGLPGSSDGFVAEASDPHGGTYMNIAVLNSSNRGFSGNGIPGFELVNFASSASVNNDFQVAGGAGGYVGGRVVLDDATECFSLDGLLNDCSPTGTSDPMITFATSWTSVLGKVTGDDVANTSDSGGSAAFATITDWLSFDGPHRVWGRDGAAFPDVTNRAGCQGAETCRIWDFSLRSSDALLRGVVVAPTTGNEVITHTWQANAVDCPRIAGATFSAGTCTSLMLRNAVEIFDDAIGNDNGLCESGETCLVTPNIGVYQGHGALVDAGTIGAGGQIQNVTLRRYATNGY